MVPLYTVAEAAALLRCSQSNIYSTVAMGKLHCFRVGAGRGGIRISEAHIEAYLRSRETGGQAPPAPRKHHKLKHLSVG